MEPNSRDLERRIRQMGKEHFIIKMVMFTQENG
jgi:hypothetical protein